MEEIKEGDQAKRKSAADFAEACCERDGINPDLAPEIYLLNRETLTVAIYKSLSKVPEEHLLSVWDLTQRLRDKEISQMNAMMEMAQILRG
jgi:hypothetical protein